MKPEPWFTLGGPARLREEVPAGDAARPAFDFRAVASVKDGEQRVTAFGADASDAVEKPVTVHPDGEERSLTDGAVFDRLGLARRVDVPADAIRGSVRGELKALLRTSRRTCSKASRPSWSGPYGCGEQTISSTYPSVLVLGLFGKDAGRADLPAVVARARGYARLGYERLLGYRAAGGGFTYWGKGEPDLALTAYALRFLNDAGPVIEVDADVVSETRTWLLSQQRADGSWPAPRWYNSGAEERRQTALTTAFVARVLAATQKADGASKAPAQPSAQSTPQTPGTPAAPPQATPLNAPCATSRHASKRRTSLTSSPRTRCLRSTRARRRRRRAPSRDCVRSRARTARALTGSSKSTRPSTAGVSPDASRPPPSPYRRSTSTAECGMRNAD